MGVYSFTERSDLERGFADVFHERIVPILERYETERVGLARRAKQWMAGTGVAGVGGAGAGFGLEAELAGTISGAVGLMGVFGSRSYYESRWQKGLGAEILPILCDFLGEMTHGDQRIAVADFSRLGVVPGYDGARLEDPVSGTHAGLDWALTEAVLTKRTRDSKGRSRNTTVFRGLLFKIAVDTPAPRIFFARDYGSMINWLSESLSSSRSGLDRLEVPDADFERTYEVYADDVDAARAYIGPGLIEGLKLVAQHEAGGGYVACAFHGDWFYIALPKQKNFLALGKLFKPTHDIEEDLHVALWDLDMPKRVIEMLTGR